MTKRLVKYLKMSGFIGLFMLIYFVAQIIVSAVGVIFIVIRTMDGLDFNFDRAQTILMKNTCYLLFISGLIALPLYLLVSVCRKEKFSEAVGFRNVGLKEISLSALFGVGQSVALTMALCFIPIERWFPGYSESMEYIDWSNLISVILGVILMGPIIEEIIFRGLILRELEKNLSTTAAVILQAVLFGIYHFNMLQSIYSFFIGLLLGLVFIWTRSIWASIAVHIFSNATSIFMDRTLGDISFEFVIIALVFGLIACVFAGRALWLKAA